MKSLRKTLADYYLETGHDHGVGPTVAADAAGRDLEELLYGWLVQSGIDEADPAAIDLLDAIGALIPIPTTLEMQRRWSAMGQRPLSR